MNANEYKTLGEIVGDINLVWSNCYAFNGSPGPTDSKNAYDKRVISNICEDLQRAMDKYLAQLKELLFANGWFESNEANASFSVPPASSDVAGRNDPKDPFEEKINCALSEVKGLQSMYQQNKGQL